MRNPTPQSELTHLLRDVRACRICEAELPLGPRPVVRAQASARILIVGQAPGTRVHETGIPWNDPSGERLRSWMNIDRDTFYDASRIAIIPMGFCYPGRNPRGGDLPPRKECADHWLARLLKHLPGIQLTILAGQYAQRQYLGTNRRASLTETVRHWQDYTPEYVPTPHPSPRNTHWFQRNPWFDEELVPYMRRRVAQLLRD